MDEQNKPLGGLNRNEGEGNKTADKQYREGATSYAKNNPNAMNKALEGERDVENYRDEYDRAEKEGRRHSAGDLKTDFDK